MSEEGYIYVDLDGTLAFYDEWRGPSHIGDPIPKMLTRIRNGKGAGKKFKIFTARASAKEQIPPVKEWLKKHGLGELEITATKGYDAIEIWDDRARQVEKNTGEFIK